MDVSVTNGFDLSPPLPFPIGGSSCFWLEATTTRDNTYITGRFSLIEIGDIDA